MIPSILDSREDPASRMYDPAYAYEARWEREEQERIERWRKEDECEMYGNDPDCDCHAYDRWRGWK